MPFLSCKTSQSVAGREILKEINIPAFPSPIDANGEPLLFYDDVTNCYIVERSYFESIIKYGLEVEAAAQALEKLK